ncbi:MAG: hypothetical protein QOF74_3237 [Caballeronia mineralivorans]|nr:hypothetical protein [Caballeronia mineralivorans]
MIVEAFDARQLMVQTHFGDISRHLEFSHMTLHHAAQVVRREASNGGLVILDPVIDGCANRIFRDVGIPVVSIETIAQACRQNIVGGSRQLKQALEPFHNDRHERDIHRWTCLALGYVPAGFIHCEQRFEYSHPATKYRISPPAPGHLSDKAKVEWTRVAPEAVSLRMLARSDLRAFEMLAQEATLRVTLEREGLTIPTGTGGSKAHPGLRALNDATTRGAQLLHAFGLTLLGRQAIDAAPPPPKENKFSQLSMGARRAPTRQKTARRQPTRSSASQTKEPES